MGEQLAETPGRRVVLDAAAALFESQGYAATSLRQIADAAGLRAASIYHHFDSKQHLFDTVLDEGIQVMEAAFSQAAELSGRRDVRPRLAAHVRAHLGALFEHGPYTAVHVTAFFTAPPEVRAANVARRDAYESLWNGLLDELLPALNVKRIRLHRLVLFGAMNTTIEWFDPGGDTSLDQLAELIADQFLAGVEVAA